MNYFSTILTAAGLAFLLGGGSSAQSRPIVLHGNEFGVWTTSHPEMLRSTPIFPAQQTWRSARPLEPLPPLPPLTEFHLEEPTSTP